MSLKRSNFETNDNIYPTSKHVKMDDTIDDLIIDAIKAADIYYIETLLFTGAINGNQIINGCPLIYWAYYYRSFCPNLNHQLTDLINLILSYKK